MRTRIFEPLEPRLPLAADLLISEFMADNETTLQDEDGDASDWIEIFNRDSTAVDLEGWHLTDKADRLTQWEFPAVQLDAGHSLIVFASGKDRDRAGSELHTNFRLSADGEYLALVAPDGVTIVDQYAPFPPQYPDVSYGPEQAMLPAVLVAPESTSRLWLPTSDGTDVDASEWTQVGFDDSSWQMVPTAIGYDLNSADGDFAPLIGDGGQTIAMRGQTPSAYLRTEFPIDGGGPVPDSLDLAVNFNDGVVAYLNGVEVARQNAPTELSWDSVATRPHGGVSDEVRMEDFSEPDDREALTLVGSANWIDQRLQLTPAAENQSGAAWLSEPLTFGRDYSFRASMIINAHSPGGTFDSDGRGGEGMTFVLQTDGNMRLGGSGGQLGLDSAGMTFLAVEFDTGETGSFDPDDSLATHVGIDTSTEGNVARAAVRRFNGLAVIPGSPGPGVDLRYVWIEYDGLTDLMEVYFAETAVQPDEPVVSAQVDLAELFGGVSEVWAGWTAGTSSAYNAHEVLSFELTSGAGQLGLDAVHFDLAQHAHLIQPGWNVLAIHGLNISADDDDFLLRPTLITQRQDWGTAKYFSLPTPGSINGVGDEAPSGAITFSASTQTFVSAFDLVLTTPSAPATIRYTTNGDLPDETSTLYTGPLRISASTRIRARAFEPDKGPGPVHSESFLRVDSTLTNFEQGKAFDSNLPLMIFDSFGKNVNSEDTLLVPVTGIFIDPGEDGRASILETPEFGGRGGMRIRGQTSQGFPKKQYALELWDEANSDVRALPADQAGDRAVSIFGLPAESDWVLNGPYSDKTQLNNYLSFFWSNKMGLYAPRARLVEVFLNQNGGSLNYSGDYLGTYVLLEKIKRDDQRVDIAALTPLDNELPAITGGYIWKKDKDGAGDVPFQTNSGQVLRMVEPEDGVITTQQKEWLRGYLNEFEAALYGPNFADPESGYRSYIDVDSWVDTWLLVEMTKNIDGFRLSTYYHKDRDGKIKQGPAWDYNLSLANGNYLRGAYPDGWYHDGIGGGDYPYWDRLFQDPAFEQQVIDRWNQLRESVFSTPALLADIDQAVAALSDGNPRLENPAVGEPSNPLSRNFDKWGTLTSYLWPNCYFGQGDCPTSPLPGGRRPQQYADYLYIMQDFVERRVAWIDSQFPAGPTMSPGGGIVNKPTQVTLEIPSGWDAYYTTDGSDPLQPVSLRPEIVLFPSGAAAQVLVPSSNQLIDACRGASLPNAADCFMNPDYVPGRLGENWTTGSLGVGYDEATTYLPYIQTDVGAQMNDQTTSVYIRIPFDVTEAQKAKATEMTLRVRYDDGFVAYLWSPASGIPVEIARANAPGVAQAMPINPLDFDESASISHADSVATQLLDFDVTAALPYVRTGENVLIIQGLNVTLGSSDFLIDAQLVLTGDAIGLPPDVTLYTGPITVDHNLELNARLFHPTRKTWSGKTTAIYLTDTPQLVISEINYHPYPPTDAEQTQQPTLEANDFEFLELKNIGTERAYLVGMEFVEGIQHTFSSVFLDPGQSGVLVKNRAAFELRYGDTATILGQFDDGSLNNGGETLKLQDAYGRVVIEMKYADNALWPARADGHGGTLQLLDPDNTPADQLSKSYRWQGSTEWGGSPGTDGLPPIPVVVNEVLSHTDPPLTASDSIELFNAGSTTITIGGWYLSDSIAEPFKFQIPAGIQLEAGQYIVFDESDFNPTPLDPAPQHFALNGAEGDDVWLTIPDGAGGVGRFVDDVHFAATANGESLGRVPNGEGYLAPMQFVTLGTANTSPRVGPIFLSEIQYQPGPPSAAALVVAPDLTTDDLEFIEVTNPTIDAVDLTEWRIRGGVDYEFADGEVLPSGQSLVIVSFDPAAPEAAVLLEAFRIHYQLAASVRLVGPYRNHLDDGDERVVLQRPDEPPLDDPSVIPRLVEDEVIFDNLPPWPVEAAGGGHSLQRIAAALYGSFASSWQAQSVTPGRFEGQVTVPGDFNGDQVVDATDIDLLAFQLRQPIPDPAYDLNADQVVDELDRDHLIQSILGTTYGDADLDGMFDSSDFVTVFQAGKYEDQIFGNASWADGDWNGDGEFDSNDMIKAFQAGMYEIQPQKRL